MLYKIQNLPKITKQPDADQTWATFTIKHHSGLKYLDYVHPRRCSYTHAHRTLIVKLTSSNKIQLFHSYTQTQTYTRKYTKNHSNIENWDVHNRISTNVSWSSLCSRKATHCNALTIDRLTSLTGIIFIAQNFNLIKIMAIIDIIRQWIVNELPSYSTNCFSCFCIFNPVVAGDILKVFFISRYFF